MQNGTHDRRRILGHLTELAGSLIAGGMRRAEPDLVLIGRVLNLLVDRVGDPAAAELISRFCADLHRADRQSQQVDELLRSLGLDELGKL